MFSLAMSRLSFPLHCQNLFVSAFNAMLVLGMCDIRGNYTIAFEFHVSDLIKLYPAFVTWIKHFAKSPDILPENDIIMIRGESQYKWQKLLVEGKLNISLIYEKDGKLQLTVNFNYQNFVKLVQSIYYLTWEALFLKEAQLTVLLPLMTISFREIYDLRNIESTINYLKVAKKKISYAFLIVYHIDVLLFLHKINRIIDYETIDENIKTLNAS